MYEYECEGCGKRQEMDFPMGKAPGKVHCPCGKKAKRAYSAVAVGVGGGFVRASGFGEQMKARNIAAARRQQGRKPPVRLAALDFGEGDVRGV